MSTGNVLKTLARTLILQAVFISIAAGLGLYFVTLFLENVLVTKALKLESDYFWEHYEKPSSAVQKNSLAQKALTQNHKVQLPHVYNLTGYLEGYSSTIPDYATDKPLGIHETFDEDNKKVYVHISENDGQRLYLVYNNAQVNKLVAVYGLIPLGCVLILLYLSTWFTYRFSNRALSPMNWLSRQVDQLNPEHTEADRFRPENLPPDANEDVQLLSAAIYQLTQRIDAFVERERLFTRDVSHELRTPLTVINANTDVLRLDTSLPDKTQASLARIKHACENMEELVQAFLALAREEEGLDQKQTLDLNTLVREELNDAAFFVEDKPIECLFEEKYALSLSAPPKVLSILFGNLFRNAVKYTEKGFVKASVGHGFVTIEDSGIGMSAEETENLFRPFFRGKRHGQQGIGVGLTIVNRIVQQHGWLIEVNSTEDKGTLVKVSFPLAEVKRL